LLPTANERSLTGMADANYDRGKLLLFRLGFIFGFRLLAPRGAPRDAQIHHGPRSAALLTNF
jgi:hypothetical protein